MKKLALLLSIATFIITGCSKDGSSSGSYTGIFNGTYNYNGSTLKAYRSHEINIIEGEDGKLTFRCEGNSSTLTKGTSSIAGTFKTNNPHGGVTGETSGPITIDGNYTKAEEKYTITGSFSYLLATKDSEGNNYETTVRGPFEITAD